MSEPHVIIIGSGLGGLSCGVVLAKNGYRVTVLEQALQIGGCLQCFKRHGAIFETGMHFIGSAAQGQTLDRILRYLDVRRDISLSQLDPQGYDVIALAGQQFAVPNGQEAFIERMSGYFPGQRDNIARYCQLVQKVASASSLHSLKLAESDAAINTRYQLLSTNEVISQTVSDPLLANVLVGNLPLYAAEKDKTPFATHAFITDFYNQSAFRIVGGSHAVATSLANTIRRHGGAVETRQRVTRIVCDNEKAIGVEVNNERFLPADYVISDAHPMRTLELLDTKLIRPAFRQRINAIPQTVGGFTVYLHFKPDTVPYMNHNYYAYQADTPWNCEHYDETSWPKGFLYMHLCHQEQPRYASTAVILSYMQFSEVASWMGTRVGQRGERYEQFKQLKAQKLLEQLEKHFPGIGANIQHYYTSTPLTYLDYTGTERGSMYGVAKDAGSPATTRVPHRTRVPNLYLTGQNINSHGILGTLVGTIVTCSEFLTAEKIYRQIMEASA